jgi:hypothetical protein
MQMSRIKQAASEPHVPPTFLLTHWTTWHASESRSHNCLNLTCMFFQFLILHPQLGREQGSLVNTLHGRAIAQAVNRWFPTAAARIWSSGICGGQSGAGVGFLRILRFPLPIFIPQNSLSSQSPRTRIIGQ